MSIKRESMTGDQLRRLREAHGLDKEQLADHLHVEKDRIKQWEADRYRIPESTSLLIRITFDPLARAQWLRGLPKERDHERPPPA